MYLRGDYTVYRPERSPELSLGPFLRLEERFRARGVVYDKLSAGAKVQILSWLTTQLYYAHQVILDSGSVQKHMVVGDIFVARLFGDFRLLDRNRNEWHATDRYYRYRNYLEVRWQTPVAWLAPWAAEELRVDSDQARINRNDLRVGVSLVPTDAVTLRTFFGFQSNRRNLSEWENTWYIGLAIGFRAGEEKPRSIVASPASHELGHD